MTLNLKVTLAQDIDSVLEWVYGEVHSDRFSLAFDLAAIFCDKSESLTVRMNAAGAFQVIAPDSVAVKNRLLGLVQAVHADTTEPVAIRSAANSMRASLLACQ